MTLTPHVLLLGDPGSRSSHRGHAITWEREKYRRTGGNRVTLNCCLPGACDTSAHFSVGQRKAVAMRSISGARLCPPDTGGAASQVTVSQDLKVFLWGGQVHSHKRQRDLQPASGRVFC